MNTNDLKQYLLSLDTASEDKNYSMMFYKKLQYLESIKQTAINDLHCHISSGYGNVNSKICFVFNNENTLKIIKPLIQDILDKLKINLWSIYITFLDKTEDEYSKKYNYLMNELNCINPDIIYVFDNNDSCVNQLKQEFTKYNIYKHNNFFQFIDIKLLSSSELNDRKLLWDSFKYMIGYKDIDR